MATQVRMPLDQAARLFGLLGNPTRLRLLWALAGRGELSVMDLRKVAGKAQLAVSSHLARLRLAGVVTSRREGHSSLYSLASDFVRELLRHVGE